MQYERTSISAMDKCQAAASSPGTCGELVQGQFPNGEDFLVTFPVNLWSRVRLELDFTSPIIQCIPYSKSKTRTAVRRTLDFLGYSHYGAKICIDSSIPEGKGMASSTADITAACRVVARALGLALSPENISRIAIEIEPSDGMMYLGAVCYNHRRGKLIETFGAFPTIDILAVDLGGTVETLQFNQLPKNYTKADLCGAFGVCVAHSGTVAGLLFEQGKKDGSDQAKDLIWRQIAPTLMMYDLQSL